MNQSEIEWESRKQHSCPNVRKGVRLMRSLMESVNQQSDGWCYWSPPSNSCKQLVALLKSAGCFNYGAIGSYDAITDAQLRKAVAPIRGMVTRQRVKQRKFGNTFDFDVDAALREPVEA